ncbi:MAG: YlqD family protein [Candidatus Xenobia bacterium]
MSIELKRQVVVKAIVTDGFRDGMIAEATDAIRNIESNLNAMQQNVSQQISSLATTSIEAAAQLKQQMEAEKDRLVKMRGELEWRIKEVQNVPNGAEMPFRVFEGTVSLAVGDDFAKTMSQAEIIIKDWKVIEIRQ